MIQSQVALIWRELLEHRAIYLTPIVIALLTILLSIAAIVAASSFDHAVNMGILGATNLGANERSAAITVMMISLSEIFIMAMWILIVFYCLDALYSERKDRSILFWRSLPLTDFETVLSKFLTAIIVIPVITFAVIVVTQLIVFLIASMWLGGRGANPWHLIWTAAPFLNNWTAILLFLLAFTVWLSPFVGWFLFVSAYTKRSPFLTAFLPIAVLPLLEWIAFRTSAIAEAFFIRSVKMPLLDLDKISTILKNGDHMQMANEVSPGLLHWLDVAGFFGSVGMWSGLVVCGLFLTAAIYVRRYRDES
jgi:ABC-2 type transport system permease protein